MIDSEVTTISETENDVVKFWVIMSQLKSPMGEHKYCNLSALALNLLSLPTSNADSERAFSLVR